MSVCPSVPEDAESVIDNFKQGEFENDPVMGLLHQSNPTLVPTLC